MAIEKRRKRRDDSIFIPSDVKRRITPFPLPQQVLNDDSSLTEYDIDIMHIVSDKSLEHVIHGGVIKMYERVEVL